MAASTGSCAPVLGSSRVVTPMLRDNASRVVPASTEYVCPLLTQVIWIFVFIRYNNAFKKGPVTECGSAATSSGVPWETI